MSEPGEEPLKVIPVSPDLYCPHCGRRLLQVDHDAEAFVLSPKAHAVIKGQFDLENIPENREVEGFLVATCLYRRCRLREWWATSERSDWPGVLIAMIVITTLASIANLVVYSQTRHLISLFTGVVCLVGMVFIASVALRVIHLRRTNRGQA